MVIMTGIKSITLLIIENKLLMPVGEVTRFRNANLSTGETGAVLERATMF